MAKYQLIISFKCDRCGEETQYVNTADKIYRDGPSCYDIRGVNGAHNVAEPTYVGPHSVILCEKCRKEYNDLISMGEKIVLTMRDSFLTSKQTKSDRED